MDGSLFSRMIYLDNSATTHLHPEVLEAMLPWFHTTFGNASSAHAAGRAARVAIEQAREEVAAAIHAHPAEFIFTSGGTESNNTVIRSCAEESGLCDMVACSAVEHHAVLGPTEYLASRGVTTRLIPVSEKGGIDPEQLRDYDDPRTLVCIMHVNNETGVVNDIARLRAAVPQAYFHTDAVQSLAKMNFDVQENGVDFASFSAHKIHGPQGIGGLFIRKGIDFKSHQHGGGQERNRRAGTESVALIVGFRHALRIALRDAERTRAHCLRLITLMREGIAQNVPHLRFNTPEPDAVLHDSALPACAPHILNVSCTDAEHLDGDAILQLMDLHGVACSNGSACVSGTMQPSHVLEAMGRSAHEARAAVRFSVCATTTEEEVRTAIEVFANVMRELRSS